MRSHQKGQGIEKLYIFQQDVKGALFPLVDKGFESHAKVKIKCSKFAYQTKPYDCASL